MSDLLGIQSYTEKRVGYREIGGSMKKKIRKFPTVLFLVTLPKDPPTTPHKRTLTPTNP